jgi:hypothetical protein
MAAFAIDPSSLDPALLLAALPDPIIAIDRGGEVRFFTRRQSSSLASALRRCAARG